MSEYTTTHYEDCGFFYRDETLPCTCEVRRLKQVLSETISEYGATIAAQAETIRELRNRLIGLIQDETLSVRDARYEAMKRASPMLIERDERIAALTAERDALREQLRKYDEWFSNIHHIGGFAFGPPLPHSKP